MMSDAHNGEGVPRHGRAEKSPVQLHLSEVIPGIPAGACVSQVDVGLLGGGIAVGAGTSTGKMPSDSAILAKRMQGRAGNSAMPAGVVAVGVIAGFWPAGHGKPMVGFHSPLPLTIQPRMSPSTIITPARP